MHLNLLGSIMVEQNVRIIRDGVQSHVFFGNVDVVINRQKLAHLHEEVRKQLSE